jgi:hypothetical protein
MDVVQETAKDKVVGMVRGTCQSPKQAQVTMINKAELVGTSSSNMQSVGAILLIGSP